MFKITCHGCEFCYFSCVRSIYSSWEGRARWGWIPWAEQGAQSVHGLLSCAVQQVMDKLHLSQKPLQGWQTAAQNWSFGSSKSHISSSPSMPSCWSLSESKAQLCPSSFPYFGEVKDWYLQQKPLQRAHKPLRSADCKQVIKVKHLLKCCADTELALPLDLWGRSCGMMLQWSCPHHSQLLSGDEQITGRFDSCFYTALYTGTYSTFELYDMKINPE